MTKCGWKNADYKMEERQNAVTILPMRKKHMVKFGQGEMPNNLLGK